MEAVFLPVFLSISKRNYRYEDVFYSKSQPIGFEPDFVEKGNIFISVYVTHRSLEPIYRNLQIKNLDFLTLSSLF